MNNKEIAVDWVVENMPYAAVLIWLNYNYEQNDIEMVNALSNKMDEKYGR